MRLIAAAGPAGGSVRRLGALLVTAPYRLADGVTLHVVDDAHPGP